jgi:hypothetical protein
MNKLLIVGTVAFDTLKLHLVKQIKFWVEQHIGLSASFNVQSAIVSSWR